ncbi:hypothetical protein ACEQPO_09345 [Bacillus sp. SL00103]
MNKRKNRFVLKRLPLWRAVQTIVIADLFMSLDNVIAVAGAAKGNMLLTAFGLMISILLFGSKRSCGWLKFPFLIRRRLLFGFYGEMVFVM